MRGKNVHTVYADPGWINRLEGGRILSRHRSKAAAVAAGREAAISRKAEHLIHNIDGRIARRNSYGSDPFPPRG